MPTPVITLMVPANGKDFGILADSYFIGGFRVVDSKAEMLQLHSSKRRVGMVCYINGLKEHWQLAGDLVTWEPWKPGADFSVTTLMPLLRALQYNKRLSRLPGSTTTFVSDAVLSREYLQVFYGRSLQFVDEDFELSSDGRQSTFKFYEDVPDDVAITVFGFRAQAE